MILAYQVQVVDGNRLRLSLYKLEISEGAPWAGTPFPLQPEKVLAKSPKGIRVGMLDRQIVMSAMMHQKLGGTEAVFEGADVPRLLKQLLETKRGYLAGKGAKPLHAAEELQAEPAWVFFQGNCKTTVDLDTDWDVIPGNPCLAIDRQSGACSELKSSLSDAALYAWLTEDEQDPAAVPGWLEKMGLRFPADFFPAPEGIEPKRLEGLEPKPQLMISSAELVRKLPMRAEVTFAYGSGRCEEHREGVLLRWVEEGQLYETLRKIEREAERLQQLQEAGLRRNQDQVEDLFASNVEGEYFQLDPDCHAHWASFVLEGLPVLEKQGWQVSIPKELEPHVVQEEDWYSELQEKGRGSYMYEQGILLHGKRINLLPVLRDVLLSMGAIRLEDLPGLIPDEAYPLSTEFGLLIIPGLRLRHILGNLLELFGSGNLDRNQRLQVHEWKAAELAEDGAAGWQPPPELSKRIQALKSGIAMPTVPVPQSFQGELREYQRAGVNWISFLYEHGLGGVLADDMGLGKTVQVIASMLHLREQHAEHGLVLIVSPSSVLPNWRQELKRFAPELRVQTHYGPQRRKSLSGFEDRDVLLTTYGTLMRDVSWLSEAEFSLAVLDEAQVVKNPSAQVSKAVRKLKARLRLALSGTPLENHLGELHSLFQFALPGYLGTDKQFKQIYRDPIEREQMKTVQQALVARIRPLMLRRSKDLVADELPPKTEIVTEIELNDEQRDLYEVVRLSGQQELADTLEGKGFQASTLQVLELLLKLRQVCCDPRLLQQEKEELQAGSAKLQWLRHHLPEMLEEGRRVLIFSQFTSMLDLIIPELQALQIPFVEIRGSTRDRETPVQRFQAKEVPVFLISLKAGGTGLNLTAADTVIFYDPWWNPAAEAQAADRAHRIGQESPVFIYKLISRGTVEARILEIQQRKKDLQNLLSGGASGKAEFTEDDFNALLAPLPAVDS